MPKKKSKPWCIRLFPLNDGHTGLKVGLAPETYVEDANTDYERKLNARDSKSQSFLLDLFNEVKADVFDGTADEVISALLGDEIHGNNPKSAGEIWTGSLKSQAEALIQLALPIVNRSSRTYYVKGTAWHMGEDGTVESMIARELGVYKHQPFHKMEVTIGGLRVSMQHKGPKPGSRAWTRENAMFHMLKDLAFEAMKRGEEPADLYLWGHFHEDLGEPYKAIGPWGEKVIYGQVLPAWCLPAEYALANVKKLEYADIGSVYYDIATDGDGHWDLIEHKKVIKKDVVERVVHETGK